MSDNLKINDYSNLEVLSFVVSAKYPENYYEALQEAMNYLNDKFTSSKRVYYSHKDLDIVEKLFISLPSEKINYEVMFPYISMVNTIKNDCVPNSVTEDGVAFYAFLGRYMRNPDPELKGLVSLYAQFLYERIAGIPVPKDWSAALKSKFYRERAEWGSYYLNAMEIFSDGLKIKKYSNLDILNFSLAQQYPADSSYAVAEAAYTLTQKFSNSEKVIFTHKDRDIFEKLLIACPLDYVCRNILPAASLLKRDIEPMEGTFFYGFLGKYAQNPDPALHKNVHSYTNVLYGKIMEISASDILTNAANENTSAVIDDLLEYYKKAAVYFASRPLQIDDSLRRELMAYSFLEAANIAMSDRFTDKDKSIITKEYIKLASTAATISKAVDYLEIAAWFDVKQKLHSKAIVDELYRTLKRTSCLTGTAYTGTIGEKMREVISLVENSPALNSNSQEKSKFTLFSAISFSRGNSLKKQQEEYIKANKLRRKFESLIEYIELVKIPFYKMEKTPELDIIMSYYDRVMNDAKRYQDLIK